MTLHTVHNSDKQNEDHQHDDTCVQLTTHTKKIDYCTRPSTHTNKTKTTGTMTLVYSQQLTQTKRRRWHNDACIQRTTLTNKKKTTSSMMLTQTKRRRFAKWRFDFTLLTVLKTTCTVTFVHSPRLWQTKRRQLAQIRLFTVNNSHKQKEDDWHKDDCIQTTSTM